MADSALYPIFDAHPGLAAMPRAGLLQGQTPVEPLGDLPGVFLKRDDLTAADYGGNKIRKLDFLLADARERGRRELVAFGYAGSNFVAATAWHGHKLGLHTTGFLLPQVNAVYIADNLSVSLAAGATLRTAPSTTRIAIAAIAHSAGLLVTQGRWPYWISPGGSSPIGVLGFINAAYELRDQVAAGLLPEPDRLYVAYSSMGTVAGLALGLVLAGMKTRIAAVQVVDTAMATPAKLAALVEKTRRRFEPMDAAFSRAACARALGRIDVRTEFFGKEYARPTSATKVAIDRFQAASGARADTAYSGKALAGLFHDLDSGALAGQTALFWHTFNAHGLPAGVTPVTAGDVPAGLRHYI